MFVFFSPLRLFAVFFSRVASEQSDESLQEEINKAHVVCIVYSVEDESSLDRLTSHWLPLIRESISGPDDQRKPVVLVGNKIDLIDYSTIDVSGATSKRYFGSIFDFIVFLRSTFFPLWKISRK